MRFKVYDKDYIDVTDKYDWYVDKHGTLFYLTNDVDSPLAEADGYWYEPEYM